MSIAVEAAVIDCCCCSVHVLQVFTLSAESRLQSLFLSDGVMRPQCTKWRSLPSPFVENFNNTKQCRNTFFPTLEEGNVGFSANPNPLEPLCSAWLDIIIVPKPRANELQVSIGGRTWCVPMVPFQRYLTRGKSHNLGSSFLAQVVCDFFPIDSLQTLIR